MKHEKFYLQEIDNLRSELQFLKGCQLRYFLFSITSVGAVLSAIGALVRESQNGLSEKLGTFVPLAPLLIVIPCWWIFFDKATTITRIVGYIRVSEQRLVNNKDFWVGWENSLRTFRTAQKNISRCTRLCNYSKGLFFGLFRIVPFFTSQKYWALNFLSFSAISVACVLTSNALNEGGFPVKIVWCLIGISFLHNLAVLGRLTDGDHSYRSMEELWKVAL